MHFWRYCILTCDDHIVISLNNTVKVIVIEALTFESYKYVAPSNKESSLVKNHHLRGNDRTINLLEAITKIPCISMHLFETFFVEFYNSYFQVNNCTWCLWIKNKNLRALQRVFEKRTSCATCYDLQNSVLKILKTKKV